jgi:hypothetical protein
MRFLLLIVLCCGFMGTVSAQDDATKKSSPGPAPVAPPPSDSTHSDSVMVTIILKYQQDKTFAELRRRLESNGFWEVFPPQDSRVVTWNVAVGFGHIVTLNMPTDGVRRLYLSISNGAWGAFNSDVFMTYDYMPIWQDYVEKRNEAKAERDDD